MKGIDELPAGKKARQPKPVTVTFTGEMAAAIRSAAKDSRRTIQQVAENYCEHGCDRPDGGKGVFIHVSSWLWPSLARLAEAADYKDGVVDLALETSIPDSVIIDCVARSLVRVLELDIPQMSAVAVVAMEEKLRHSKDGTEKHIAENIYHMEVDR